MTAGRFVPLGHGYPPFCEDVTRSVARAGRRLAGENAVITFDRDPEAIAAAWYDVTAARAARNLAADPPRPVGLTGWRHAWGQAGELATLRVGGDIAAWLIARTGPDVYEVIAGQMNGKHRRLLPGIALEAVVLARAMCGPAPWPPLPELIENLLKADLYLCGGGYAPHAVLDWGPGHPETLLTR